MNDDTAVDKARKDLLRDLIELRRPIRQTLASLSKFAWDCERALVLLKSSHVVAAIQLFIAGDLSAEELHLWGEAIEGREDIGFGVNIDAVKGAIFELANPELFGNPSETIPELLRRLQRGGLDDSPGK